MIVYIIACLSSLFSLLLHPVQQDLPTTPLEVALFPLPGYRIQPYHTTLSYDLVFLAVLTGAPGGCRLHPFWFPPSQSPVVLMHVMIIHLLSPRLPPPPCEIFLKEKQT